VHTKVRGNETPQENVHVAVSAAQEG